MAIVVSEEGAVHIPAWVIDFPSFLRWAESEEFPDEARICFINGEVWADLTVQQIYSHLRVKVALSIVIGGLAQQTDAGMYLPDGLRVNHTETGLSAIPDGAYLAFDSVRAGRVRLVEGKDRGFTAVEGSPDLVIEVVSDSSEDKDTEWLMSAYWDAGIREYWLIDARAEPPRFDVYRHGPKGFTATRKAGGWVKSAVLGRSFKLTAVANALGHPDFRLDVR